MNKGTRPLVAVIPARAGSKGIPGKNLRVIEGFSLLERSILLAKKCPDCVDRVLVTTDDPSMQEIAKSLNAATPSLRPAELAGDRARTIDVLIHLIHECGLKEADILLLQPTSPLRTSEDLRAVVRLYRTGVKVCRAVASVSELTSTHPDKVQKITDGYLETYIPGVLAERPRQEMARVFSLNGAFYLTSAAVILEEKTLLPRGTCPYEMPKERSINLDHAWDMILLETLRDRSLIKLEEY